MRFYRLLYPPFFSPEIWNYIKRKRVGFATYPLGVYGDGGFRGDLATTTGQQGDGAEGQEA